MKNGLTRGMRPFAPALARTTRAAPGGKTAAATAETARAGLSNGAVAAATHPGYAAARLVAPVVAVLAALALGGCASLGQPAAGGNDAVVDFDLLESMISVESYPIEPARAAGADADSPAMHTGAL